MGNLPVAEFAALGAAVCWTCSAILTAPLVHHFGAVALNRYRVVFAGLVLVAMTSAMGLWQTLPDNSMLTLIGSSLIGIVIGDTALMQALKRIGPRRNSVLFATSAPMAAGLGFLWLGETLSTNILLGCGLILVGVVNAVWWGRKAEAGHKLEQVTGHLGLGVALGLIAALGQAAGAVMAKPVLLAGADPIAASAIRVGFAALVLLLVRALPFAWAKANAAPTPAFIWRTMISSTLGLVLGMTLVVYALGVGEVGVVITLSSITPVLILPVVWFITGQRPSRGAWLGAALVVIGSALIFLSN
ncbi:MAG TPA: EamA family transporter [Oceanospirillaceae bacterium]|nr:EamA family transporter [Oceanospirillaceae bacterium]